MPSAADPEQADVESFGFYPKLYPPALVATAPTSPQPCPLQALGLVPFKLAADPSVAMARAGGGAASAAVGPPAEWPMEEIRIGSGARATPRAARHPT